MPFEVAVVCQLKIKIASVLSTREKSTNDIYIAPRDNNYHLTAEHSTNQNRYVVNTQHKLKFRESNFKNLNQKYVLNLN